VGELIRDAINRGCRRFIIGIGGSATNDGGTGMLSALGFSFLDAHGRPIPPGAAGLAQLHSLSGEEALPQLKECTFRIACDVENPLCGPAGCSAVFAPQKGATPESIPLMDGWLSRYADLAAAQFPKGDKNCPGAGAAGGLGFAFLTFLNARLESGIRIILDETRLEEDIHNADLVITGEGRLDGQTLMGKAPIGVAALAKKHGKKVVALAGCVTGDAHLCNGHGIDAFFPILPGPATVDEAMEPSTAARNLANTACQVFRLLSLC
jgi:glycerate kinase